MNISEIKKKSTKLNLVQSINQLMAKSRSFQLVSYLNGYLTAKLNLNLTQKPTIQLFNKINDFNTLINEKMISRSNAIQIIIQVIYKILNDNYQDSTTRTKQALSKIQYLFQDIIGNQSFLRQKWQRQQFDEQQNKKSLQFAMKLMQQQKNQRLKKQNVQLQCQICLVEIEMKDVGTLGCGHMFHRQCLGMHMKNAIDNNRLQIKCPMEQCGKSLNMNDIKQFIDGPLLQKFDQFWFNKYVQMNSRDTSWCPTPGCTSVFQFDQLLTNYRCPGCQMHYCLKCKCKYHEGMTCAQYRVNNSWGQDDKKFQQFVRGAKYKQCPKCNFWVQRVAGCSTMSCRCGNQFCYDCGGSDCPHGACKNKGKIMPMLPFRRK